MSRTLLTDEQIAFLASLEESKVVYVVVGMSAAILQGVPGSTQDIDLWVGRGQTEALSEACRRVGGVYAWRGNPPTVAGPGLDDFDLVWDPHGLKNLSEEMTRSELVELSPGLLVPVLPLDRVIASKKAANRPKDRSQLPILRDALAALKRTRDDERRKKHTGIHLTPSLLAWAFTYPDDPAAMKVIASLPPDVVPKLKETFELERSNHDKITALFLQALKLPIEARTTSDP